LTKLTVPGAQSRTQDGAHHSRQRSLMGTNERARIVMTAAEVAAFLQRSRTATVASVGPGGLPHVVAMWYGISGDAVYIETKAKSQKAVNLRRDPRMVFMVEAGDSYDTLRGVSLEGTATIIEGGEEYWSAAISVYERYTGPYAEDARPVLEFMMAKRVVAKLVPARVRSWDHRKLGMAAMAPAGATAASIGQE
jgi:PPOX class probable F420-dependent enzyme